MHDNPTVIFCYRLLVPGDFFLAVLLILWNFMHSLSDHLRTKVILFLPSQSICLLFPLSYSLVARRIFFFMAHQGKLG